MLSNYELLEQLSYIFHFEENIPKLQALHCINMLADFVLVHGEGQNYSPENTEDTENYTKDFSVATRYAIATIDKYSSVYKEKNTENTYMAQNMMKYMKVVKKCKQELEVQFFDNFESNRNLAPIVDEECAAQYAEAYGPGDIIDLYVTYSGIDFFTKQSVDDEWVKNGDLNLTAGYTYKFNLPNISGHPLVIKKNLTGQNTAIDIFNGGDPIPTGFQVTIPSEGISEINGYGPIYYECQNNADPSHFPSGYNVDINIIGTNDEPTIFLKSPYHVRIEEVQATGQAIHAEGTIKILDLDFGDTLTPVVTPRSFFGALSQASNITIDTSGIKSNGSEIEIDWVYQSPAVNLDFLRKDYYISIDYDIKIFDQYENSNTERLRINIVGTNDDPYIIPGGQISGTITKLPDEDPGAGSATLSTYGIFNIGDPDLGDTHTISYIAATDTIGIFNVGIQNKVVTWTYEVNDGLLSDFGPDEAVEEIYSVTVADNHGEIAEQLVYITLYGSDGISGLQIKKYEPEIFTLLSATGVDITETDIGLFASGTLDASGILVDNLQEISFQINVNVTGYTSGLNVSENILKSMLTAEYNIDDQKIYWEFDSQNIPFNYLPESKKLELEYSIFPIGDREGGTLNILPPFAVAIVPIRPEAILPTGTHNYIDAEYWSNNEDVPLKYGGIGDIKAISSQNSFCWDYGNFKYKIDGFLGSTEFDATLVFPFYPPSTSYVSQFETFNWSGGRYEKILYSSAIFEQNNRSFQLKIGRSPNDWIAANVLPEGKQLKKGEYSFYDSPGDIDPFFRSTRWPAEKITLSINNDFIPDSNIYPTGSGGDYLEFGIVSDNNLKLLNDSAEVTYRNISLVDIRANAYPVETITAYSPRDTLNPGVGYSYTPYPSFFTSVDENNAILDSASSVDKILNNEPAYATFNINVIVQNREWHRDAGHALIKQFLEVEEDRGEFDIVDVTNIGSYNKIYGYVPWYNGGLLDIGSKLVKYGGIRGTIAGHCVCGEDQNGDGILDPIDCGCNEILNQQYMTFPPYDAYGGPSNINDLEVGMFVYGPYVPFGTRIESIHRAVADGACGPAIRLTNAVNDEDPITGANFGYCTYYFPYSFTKFPNQAYKQYDFEYPLRSNRGVVFNYGYLITFITTTFVPLFYSFEFYNEWTELDIGDGAAIDRLETSPLMYRTQIFTQDTGWTLSSWNKCRRQISRSAIEPKLGMSFEGAYPYSPIYCNGLYPAYDIGFMDCNILCSPTKEVDVCCVAGSTSRSFLDPCLPQDIVDYEGNSFYDFPVINYDGYLYFLVPSNRTGHTGNSEFPSGIVPDPLRRPMIDAYEPSSLDELIGICYSEPSSFSNIWLGYIDPSVEVTRNYNTNRSPGVLHSDVIQGVTPKQCAVSDDPFYVYQEHGYEQFIVLMRAKKAVVKYLPIYPVDASDIAFEYQVYFPGMSPLDEEGYCIYSETEVDYSAGNLITKTILNNLHININKNIENNYPNNTDLLDNQLSNSVNFAGDRLYPPTTETIFTNTCSLNSAINNQALLDHFNEYKTAHDYINIQALIKRQNNYLGNEYGIVDNYCYYAPQDVSLCSSGTVSYRTQEELRSLQHLNISLFGTPDYLPEIGANCCNEPYNYGKNACECILSNWDSDKGANRHWNQLGFNTPFRDLDDLGQAADLTDLQIHPHIADKSYTEALLDTFGYQSQAYFYFEGTVNNGTQCNSFFSTEVFGLFGPEGEGGYAIPNTFDCCQIPNSSICPLIYSSLFSVEVIDESATTIPITTVGHSFAYSSYPNWGNKAGIIKGTLEWYPDETNGTNFQGNDLMVRFKLEHTAPKDVYLSQQQFYINYSGDPTFKTNMDNALYNPVKCEFVDVLNKDPYTDYLKTFGCCVSDPSVTLMSIESSTSYSDWQKLSCDSKRMGFTASISSDTVSANIAIQGDCFAAFLLNFYNGCYYGPTELFEA